MKALLVALVVSLMFCGISGCRHTQLREQLRCPDEHWRPLDTSISTQSAVYSLGPFAADRVPVLFVHGMNGSPANFAYLVDRLDDSRFQAWVYSYHSGTRFEALAEDFVATIESLRSHHRFGAVAIVAHSMGGLLARDFILKYAHNPHAAPIPLLVTISTPWEGHEAAELAPPFIHVWRDIAPGSPYLRSLFDAPLPVSTHHYLLFTFNRRSSSYGASSDRTVTVASQLSALAQQEAVRVIGFDDTHDGVLRNPEVAALINHLLEKTFVKARDPDDSSVTIAASTARDRAEQQP